MSERVHLILGAGHAGGRAAQAMRAAGFEGRIVLVGEEGYLPYERPPLSKELLQGEDGIEKARLNDQAFYDEARIELRLGVRAEAIDRDGRVVRLTGGETLGYDRLLLTTGARVRRLEVPGAHLEGVHYLRDFDDTVAIRAALKTDARAVVIGGGFIGLEAAASARKRGCTVSVVEIADQLMGRAVARSIADYFAELHRRNGTDVLLGSAVEAIAGSGRVEGVRLREGPTLAADIVIVGIGIVPNTEIAADAGLTVDNGIVVDEFGRTSDPIIFAAGDCANQPNAFAGGRVRLESYQNAQDQGMAVARNMCTDAPTAYQDTLWVWTDQYDVNLQMCGRLDDWDTEIDRGTRSEGKFTVFYLKDGRIVAVNTVNNGRDMRIAQRLMASGRSFDAAVLADPAANLLKLSKGG